MRTNEDIYEYSNRLVPSRHGVGRAHLGAVLPWTPPLRRRSGPGRSAPRSAAKAPWAPSLHRRALRGASRDIHSQ